MEELMQVIIGIDPHKASHTAVAVSGDEDELARLKVRASRGQLDQLLTWATPFPSRTWAIEGAEGLGFLLAQQLVTAGETVVDVPATLAARTRVLGTGRSNKNDPNDAMSVAVTALRTRDLRRVSSVGNSEVLRLLSKRNLDIGRQRSRTVSRLHALLVELAPGGIAREINVSNASAFLAGITAATAVEQIRYDLANDLLDDIGRLDDQLNASHKRIGAAVAASSTTVTELFGVGPMTAAILIGNTGDIGRFRNRDHFAAYTGTAPVEFSSGGRTAHRLSRRGNRTLNAAIHMAAVTQLRHHHSDGRAYFERKVAEGKTKREALRSLKRHVSNAIYRQLLADANRLAR
jgi:transposase